MREEHDDVHWAYLKWDKDRLDSFPFCLNCKKYLEPDDKQHEYPKRRPVKSKEPAAG